MKDVVVKDEGNMDQVIKELKALDHTKVDIGFFASEDSALTMIAGVQEFGCNITVTKAMRGWLGAHGLHLRRGTTEIHIPERSFIRAGFDKSKNKGLKVIENGIAGIFEGQTTAAEVANLIGVYFQGALRKAGIDLKSPPLHPFTIKMRRGKKGGANPLYDTGRMLKAITYKVKK